jgi:hypothetical protein
MFKEWTPAVIFTQFQSSGMTAADDGGLEFQELEPALFRSVLTPRH